MASSPKIQIHQFVHGLRVTASFVINQSRADHLDELLLFVIINITTAYTTTAYKS